MNDTNWKARVIERPGTWDYALYLAQEWGSKRTYLTAAGTEVVLGRGETSKEDPYFAVLNMDQLQAIAEAITANGVKTRPVHQLEGVVSAQSAHLEDMRALVFKQPHPKREVQS